MMQGWLAVGLAVALGIAADNVLLALERQRPASVRAEELSYLPKGEYLKVAVLGYDEFAADLIWLKAVQHLGATRQSKSGYAWAYHVVNVVTDLDPKFLPAYLASGTILGVWAGLLYESIDILRKGMRENPDVWQLPYYIGYDYFYELCDPARAAPYFQAAARLPGAPAYLPSLAARMTVAGGDPDAALEFLQRLYEHTGDPRLREALEQKIKEVIVERDIRALQEGVRQYRARYGRPPRTLRELVAKGIAARLPEEPFGGRYELELPSGTVKAVGRPERLDIYRTPATTGCKPRDPQPYRGAGRSASVGQPAWQHG
jgi:tetratricopeptide (TPR) repeat protein